jgi:C1A family cysteine protease
MGKTEYWGYACGNWWTIDIDMIKEALVNHGPLATGMDVYSDFYGYSGGVYRRTSGTYQGGHAVLITGYTDNANVPGGGYFIAKNSWGTGWGPYGGYFAVAYDSNCNFGIESTYYNGVIVYDR